MGRLFGTDGAAGRAVSELTCELAMSIGKAAAVTFAKRNHRRAKLLIGKDTRASCDVLESALIAGICSVGADVHILGVIPAPAVAYLTVKYGADAGIVISGSRSAADYNGIKLFSASGFKLPDDIEEEIERLVLDSPEELLPADTKDLGNVKLEKNAEWDYVRFLLRNINTDLGRMKLVVDCANGASYSCAEKFFRGLGASVVMINNTPDGLNINKDCGTSHTEQLSSAVIANRAHAGIALDGDADRCAVVDEKGELIDGDRILALLALDMKRDGALNSNTCVVTQATNLGFFRWAKEQGIVVSTASGLGEKNIIERMISDGYSLGGEPSGKMLFGGITTTADGELSAAKLLEIAAKSQRKLSELSDVFTPYPQLNVDVVIRQECRGMLEEVPEVNEIIEFSSGKLAGEGRIMVRESGTEPLVRVTAEGRDGDAIYQYAHAVAQVINEHLGVREEDENS